MDATAGSLVKALPFIVPLFLLEVGLLVFALIDVVRRPHVRGNNKLVWILIIVFFSMIGPIVYLAVGRKEAVIDRDKD
jgi:hypothetical protein